MRTRNYYYKNAQYPAMQWKQNVKRESERNSELASEQAKTEWKQI